MVHPLLIGLNEYPNKQSSGGFLSPLHFPHPHKFLRWWLLEIDCGLVPRSHNADPIWCSRAGVCLSGWGPVHVVWHLFSPYSNLQSPPLSLCYCIASYSQEILKYRFCLFERFTCEGSNSGHVAFRDSNRDRGSTWWLPQIGLSVRFTIICISKWHWM